MKKIILVLTMLFVAAGAVFAQSDLQPLVIVKYNKAETITLKPLPKTTQKLMPTKLHKT